MPAMFQRSIVKGQKQMSPEEMLEKRVAFKSVVGQTNRPLIEFVASWLGSHGIEANVMPGPEGDRDNLFATIGPSDRRGYILSGHTDVVPAGEPEWQ
ncbi:MAG: hypothetical protein ABGW90_00845, partial [Martelella sp.]